MSKLETVAILTGRSLIFRRGVRDFDAVLQNRPQHPDARWNRGLARQELCELESRTGDPAQSACEGAIADFTNFLRPGAYDEAFFTQLPDEADVLFNRGYAHMLSARLNAAKDETRVAHLTAAIRDFDGVLAGGARYAGFLNRRRKELIQLRQSAEKERAKFATPAHITHSSTRSAISTQPN